MILGVGALVTGLALDVVVEKRYRSRFDKIPLEHQVVEMNPAVIRSFFLWAIDASQILVIALGPAVGLIFLIGDAGPALIAVYTVVLVMALGASVRFIRKVNPTDYGPVVIGGQESRISKLLRRWPWLTAVPLAGILLNLVAAAIAAGIVLLS
ncbi:MAG: hypothetical protein JST59_03720 [Actinobacteria bacterium]|nr:hypothetical protein [Actinomycetota bacterium]